MPKFDDYGDECAICLDVLAEDTTTTLPCGHAFHTGCLRKLDEAQKMDRGSPRCPKCRARFTIVRDVGRKRRRRKYISCLCCLIHFNTFRG